MAIVRGLKLTEFKILFNDEKNLGEGRMATFCDVPEEAEGAIVCSDDEECTYMLDDHIQLHTQDGRRVMIPLQNVAWIMTPADENDIPEELDEEDDEEDSGEGA